MIPHYYLILIQFIIQVFLPLSFVRIKGTVKGYLNQEIGIIEVKNKGTVKGYLNQEIGIIEVKDKGNCKEIFDPRDCNY